MRQRSSQLVFLLLLLCALPYGEVPASGLVRAITAADLLQAAPVVRLQAQPLQRSRPFPAAGRQSNLRLTPAAQIFLNTARPVPAPTAQAAALAGYTGLLRS